MASVYDPDNFSGRVNYAATVITRRGAATRHFDTCFEMYDGDAVAAALIRRSERNLTLAQNLPRYLNEESARQAAQQLAGKKLADAAREMREAAAASTKRAAFDPAMVRIERHRLSVTQGEVSVSYDGRLLGRFHDHIQMASTGYPGEGAQVLGGWFGMSDDYWRDVARARIEAGK